MLIRDCKFRRHQYLVLNTSTLGPMTISTSEFVEPYQRSVHSESSIHLMPKLSLVMMLLHWLKSSITIPSFAVVVMSQSWREVGMLTVKMHLLLWLILGDPTMARKIRRPFWPGITGCSSTLTKMRLTTTSATTVPEKLSWMCLLWWSEVWPGCHGPGWVVWCSEVKV